VADRLSQSGCTKKILIIEDDRDMRVLLADHFGSAGYQVETATDGNEAIARALRMHPDAILVDLMMPGLDGWDTARILRTYPSTKHIPLIACTGANEAEPHRASVVSWDAIVRKPCSAAEVEGVVDHVLARNDSKESDAG
jgi:CheY-like chemotaxis protein